MQFPFWGFFFTYLKIHSSFDTLTRSNQNIDGTRDLSLASAINSFKKPINM